MSDELFQKLYQSVIDGEKESVLPWRSRPSTKASIRCHASMKG